MEGSVLTAEGENKSAGWAEVYAVFPAVMGELNSGKIPNVLVFTTHGQWPMVRQQDNGNLAY